MPGTLQADTAHGLVFEAVGHPIARPFVELQSWDVNGWVAINPKGQALAALKPPCFRLVGPWDGNHCKISCRFRRADLSMKPPETDRNR